MTQQAESDALQGFERASLERIRLATNVIIELGDEIPSALEADLTILRERVERVLLLPDRE